MDRYEKNNFHYREGSATGLSRLGGLLHSEIANSPNYRMFAEQVAKVLGVKPNETGLKRLAQTLRFYQELTGKYGWIPRTESPPDAEQARMLEMMAQFDESTRGRKVLENLRLAKALQEARVPRKPLVRNNYRLDEIGTIPEKEEIIYNIFYKKIKSKLKY